MRILGAVLYDIFKLFDLYDPFEMFGNICSELKIVTVAKLTVPMVLWG